MILYGICLLYLGITGIADLKNQKVNVPLSVMFALIAIILRMNQATIWLEILAAVFIGVGVLIVSILTKQAIGSGDGVALIVVGLYLGFYRSLQVFFISMIGVFVTGMILILVKKKGWKAKIPYIPYLFLGEVIMLLWGI